MPGANPRVTLYRIEGMGHGTPLKAGTGPRAREIAGDYMLDVGISSTRHLADDWGLKKPTLATVLARGGECEGMGGEGKGG